MSICDVQTKLSFFLDFGIHYTCSFPPLHFSRFFYCNIYYKTRKVATCSHSLPFILPCSPSSPSPPVPSFYPLTRVLFTPAPFCFFVTLVCLAPPVPLVPLVPSFLSCFLFLPVPLVLLCSPCSKHFIMILYFSVLINILKFLVES